MIEIRLTTDPLDASNRVSGLFLQVLREQIARKAHVTDLRLIWPATATGPELPVEFRITRLGASRPKRRPVKTRSRKGATPK